MCIILTLRGNFMKNMVYIQSGGPTSVINSSLYGAIKEAREHRDQIGKIYGSLNGIDGLINDNLIDIDQESNKDIELLKQTPGAILGSTRLKLPKYYHDPLYVKIVNTLAKHNIGYIFINGGNDSMDTCMRIARLCEEDGLDVKVIGVPKTIDNDLAITDHSLGFGSAAKYVANTIAHIAMDARAFKKGKVHIIEVMGRNAGWLTASTDILPEEFHPDLIYIPEKKLILADFMKQVQQIYDRNGSVIIALSEGVSFDERSKKVKTDSFGHPQLEGVSDELGSIVEEDLGLPVRTVELSVPQRACAYLISKSEQQESIETGRRAVKAALAGETGKMVTLKRVSNNPYKIEFELADVSKIANEVRMIPQEWLVDETRLSDEFREYVRPLVEGEIKCEFENGIPKFSHFKKVKVK